MMFLLSLLTLSVGAVFYSDCEGTRNGNGGLYFAINDPIFHGKQAERCQDYDIGSKETSGCRTHWDWSRSSMNVAFCHVEPVEKEVSGIKLL